MHLARKNYPILSSRILSVPRCEQFPESVVMKKSSDILTLIRAIYTSNLVPRVPSLPRESTLVMVGHVSARV